MESTLNKPYVDSATYRTLLKNGAAWWAEPCVASLFSNNDSGLPEKMPSHCHWEGGEEKRLQLLEHVTLSTLNMGETSNMFQKLNLSLYLHNWVCLFDLLIAFKQHVTFLNIST